MAAAEDLDEWPLEETSSSFQPSSRSLPVQPEFWNRVEEATREIIEHVHPTLVSEDRRRDVIDYMQRLIRMTLGCEVHSFGSVPLKTYLPDGDIDLTAFGGPCHEEDLAHQVFSVLDREEHNVGAPFMIKDVQLIRAEVKLVKCLVQNIVVDISFNQLGGICTLCFLEKIDHLIGKDHLFKRSIILIKAWCYYESRILGALHGLISTYALETLVLYIFHLFHSSLDGPLAVLYKFLDYFSKFDWDNYCISLSGPVNLSSLPEIVVETPENEGQDLLLTSEFLKECLELYSVPSRGFETNPRVFPVRHLNIIDPLKENNNLGRSVSKGNFYRIRSAFTYGARKLGQIFLQSEEDLSFELRKFFSNMLHRHGSGQRPDVLDVVPYVRFNRNSAMSHGANHFQDGQMVYESESSSSSGAAPATGNGRHDQEDLLCTGGANASRLDVSGLLVETAPSVSDSLSFQKLEISEDAVNSMESVSHLNGEHHAPHHIRNGEVINEKAVEKVQENHSKRVHSSENVNDHVGHEDLQFTGSVHHTDPVAVIQEDMHLQYSGHFVSDTPNSLSELTGDYESQLNSLRYGRWWFDYVQNGPLSPLSPHGLSQLPNNNSWEVVRHAMPFGRNAPGPVNVNGVVPRQVFFHMNPQMIPNANFGMEELPKPRGTGTYFPNANFYRDRPFPPRRNSNQTRSPRNNGPNGSCEMSQVDSFESLSDANGSAANHQYERSTEPFQAELRSPPEGSSQSDLSVEGCYNQSHRLASIPSSTEEERVTHTQSYYLADDHEFPPL
ncbi:PAP/OAS1 substrate-binding domain superfamily [Raphanus sativus]|nr:PAP/OAS1 substrate-binding domain superfamily [Raphanus sativus]